MSNDCALRLGRFIATVAMLFGAMCAQTASAQPMGLLPSTANRVQLPNEIAGSGSYTNQQGGTARRGPLARLIENPDQTDGTPPFALTDDTGTVQRYVEPVPGVDLAAHVRQIVAVRNDTGPTLLASQIEFPNQPILPLVMESQDGRVPTGNRNYRPQRQMVNGSGVEQVQYVDNDDSSVQLLPDDMSMVGGGVGPAGMNGQLPMLGDAYPGYPMQGQMCGPECGPPCCDARYGDPMQYSPGMMAPSAGPMVAPVCAEPQGPHLSAAVEFTFFRAHFNDQPVGKLSETYEFSPRFILSFQDLCNLDGRLRYWHYDRGTNVAAGDVRLQFDVADIEATHRFQGLRSEVTLAAGIRMADVHLIDVSGDQVSSDLLGLTMAADGLTPIFRTSDGYCGWVYGGRISLLGGNWNGNPTSDFLTASHADDNVLVTELYAGGEIARRCGNFTVGGRVVFEMQNWRSDVLAQNAGPDSISILGPVLQIGADF